MSTSDYLLAAAVAVAMLFIAAVTVPPPPGARLAGQSVSMDGHQKESSALVPRN
jgi:hypothetical protein